MFLLVCDGAGWFSIAHVFPRTKLKKQTSKKNNQTDVEGDIRTGSDRLFCVNL